MGTGKSIEAFDISDVSAGCNYSDDIAALTKNQSPDSMNVEFFNGRIRKRKGERAFTTPPTGQGGIDSYTKLLLHCDGTNASTTFTDSETTPKTVTANGNAQIVTAQSKFGGASGLFTAPGIDSYTKLMLHMDGADTSTTFTDSALTPKTVTANGNAQIDTALSKFGGASGLFDGTGDYLSTAASSDFDFGTGDFTIDLWHYSSITQPDGTGIVAGYTGAGTGWLVAITDTGHLFFLANGTDQFECSSVVPLSSWVHIAIVRSGNVLTAYQNGVSVGTLTVTAGHTVNTDGNGIVVGRARTDVDNSYFTGSLDELRISKGIARWTTNFTPPTLAYCAGDYLTIPDSDDFYFGTGDFTIDCQIYPTSLTGECTIIGQYVNSGTTTQWVLESSNGGTADFYVYSADVLLANYQWPLPSLNTWTHLAIVRSGSSFYVFYNGVAQTVTTYVALGTSSIPNIAASLYIGSRDGSSKFFSGYLDEVRISKGIARWTVNFTAPMLAYDTFSASVPLIGFSVVDFSNTTGYHQQVAHLGTTVYAYDRVTNTKVTLRSGAPYFRSYNARISSYLIQTYNNYSVPYYWDGSSSSMAVLSVNAPSFKRTIEFQGYLIGMNVSSAKTRCYYQPISNLIGGGAAYTDYFTLTPAPNDDEISDAFLINGRLYVGTKYAIFRVSFVGGVTVFEFKQVISDTGVVPMTTQTVITKQFGQVALFLGTDKRVYMFDGANVKAISDLFFYHNDDTPISLDLIDDNYKENSFAIYDPTVKIYRLFVTKFAQSTNYYVMNIDVDTFAYYPFDNLKFSAGCVGYDRLLKPYLIAADYTGSLHKLFIDTNTDNGTSINEYYVSPLVSVKTQMIKQGQTIDLSFVPSSSAKLKTYVRVDYRRAWEFLQDLPLADKRDKFLGENFVLNSSPLGSERSICYSHISLATSFNCFQFKVFSSRPTARRWELIDINVNQTVLALGKAEAQR